MIISVYPMLILVYCIVLCFCFFIRSFWTHFSLTQLLEQPIPNATVQPGVVATLLMMMCYVVKVPFVHGPNMSSLIVLFCSFHVFGILFISSVMLSSIHVCNFSTISIIINSLIDMNQFHKSMFVLSFVSVVVFAFLFCFVFFISFGTF